MYQALIRHGYQPDSGVPITLIGFSGGGQMAEQPRFCGRR